MKLDNGKQNIMMLIKNAWVQEELFSQRSTQRWTTVDQTSRSILAGRSTEKES